jgi:MOSC domain-containing protein YiiM
MSETYATAARLARAAAVGTGRFDFLINRPLRLCGIFCRIARTGQIRVGDLLEVLPTSK